MRRDDRFTIARHFRCHEETVRPWIKAFLARGFDALADQPHPGQRSRLTPAMEETIRADLRRDARTWTAAQLTAWVAEQFGVRLSPAQLGRRLKRAGIVYKRASRSLKHKQDPEEVRRWLEETYPAIEGRAEKEGAEIYWCDETGAAADHPFLAHVQEGRYLKAVFARVE